jgi:hypothetical protein
MSNFSTVVEFLNENEYRGYPLLETSNRYFTIAGTEYDLFRLIVDAQIGYANISDSFTANITSITTDSSNLTIHITGTQFTVTNYLSATYPHYAYDTNYNLLVIGEYALQLPTNSNTTITNAIFEPSVIYEKSITGVNSVTISGHVLTGDITLREGYQVSLIPKKNNIDLEVGRNEGIPLPCGDFRGLTSDCDTVISSINGVTPNKTGHPISIIGKNHITVFDDPDNHRIYIGYDFKLADVPAQQLIHPTPVII